MKGPCQGGGRVIVVDLIGGLGNQMFQYAAARALSLSKGVPLYLDASAFEQYGLHRFELTRVFDCHAGMADRTMVKDMLGWQANRSVRTLAARLGFGWLRSCRWVEEPSFDYWPGLKCVPDTCYLTGYWQSEKYFHAVSDVIRKDLTFKIPLEGLNKTLAGQMAACQAISLHIRRGDYVSDASANQKHGTCSLQYYAAAVDWIAARVERPEFFVFSDDIAWAREHLGLSFPVTFVDHNRGDDNYRDMQLMSLCRHHIIANSSFSWWGAWLNGRADKIVIAPRQWFASGEKADDLIPSDWVRL